MKWELLHHAPPPRRCALATADDDAVDIANDVLARIILDEMREFVSLLDDCGRTLSASRNALDAAQVGIEDLRGRPFWEAPWWGTTRENQQFTRRLVERACSGESVRGQLEMFHPQAIGQTVSVELALRPLQDASRRVVYLLAEASRVSEDPLGRFADAQESPVDLASAKLARRLGARTATAQGVQTPCAPNPTVDAQCDTRPLMLIAEDHADLREFLTELFTDEYRLKTAADGREALSLALAEPPDLLITDLMMPRLSGERLISEMRKHPSLSQVPVLVLSGSANEALRLQLLVGSVQDYVLKPFSAPELCARVRNLAVPKRARDALQKELMSHDEDLWNLTQQLIESQRRLQRTLEAQRTSEERWRVVFENSAVGVYMTDIDGRFLETNGRLQRTLGYAASEFASRSLLDLLPLDERVSRHATLAQLRAGTVLEHRSEHRYLCKDGNTLWVNDCISMIPGTGKRPSMFVGIVEDITERKLVEAESQALKEKLASELVERRIADSERRKLVSLAENSADFIAVSSLDGETEFVNRAGLELLGAALHWRKTHLLDFMVEEDRERLGPRICAALAREGRWSGEVRFRHFETGAAIPMLMHTFYIKEPGSECRVALATISRDITERKLSEVALRKAQEGLAHVTRVMSMGELTTSIAHEINQPLTAIVTNGNACKRWLDRDVPNVPEARIAIERIVRDGQRAGEVVRRIRSFSKKVDPNKTLLDIDEIVDEVLALAHDELLRQRVQARVERDNQPTPFLGDRIQIQQVLLNLIMNGIEAMSAVQGRAKQLVVTTRSDAGREVRVSVQDCGVGLDPGANAGVDSIFEPFFTTKPEGMGLGLSISRSIVESHGGQLWAVPNASHGLTMHARLPTRGEPAEDL
jgi:PAS domain S-box-containing protein